jgi:methyl-accepting chemotaxis protein
MKMLKNMKIGTKLILVVVFLLTIVSLGIGLMSYFQAYNSVHNQVTVNAPQIAAYGAQQIKNTLDYYKLGIESIALNPDIRSMDWGKKQIPVLESETKRLGFLGMGIITPDGVASYPDGTTANLGDRAYFKRAMDGETNYSDVIISRVTNSAVMMLATPLKGSGNKVVAVLIARLDASWLSNVTDKVMYGEKGYSYIIDGKGTLIAHANRDYVLEQKNFLEEGKTDSEFAGLSNMFQKMTAGETGFDDISFLGIDRIFGFTTIPGTNWSIAVGANKTDVFAQVSTMRINIAVIALVFLTIGVILMITIARREITRPINNTISQLGSVSENVLNGRLDVRTQTQGVPLEFAPIFHGINGMIDAFVSPINVTAEYVDRISKGDIPPLITQEYRGEFNTIKNNLNLLVESTNDIILKAKLVAEGDLSVELIKRSENDELIEALSEMVAKLNNIVDNILQGAANIASASSQMSIASQQMSSGTSQQASSAEEVSSSIEQMSANIQQNSDNAQQTEKIAVKSSTAISEANKAVETTVKAMQEIAEKITIINDIAEKTDILAINAAIEAARAGEHGKGFAVVAAEVRKLAENSQAAAREIGDVSKKSVEISRNSGILLSNVVPDIQKTTSLVQEIAAASSEQSSGINQITSAISQFNSVVQQNAASSEELSSNSEELAAQAEALKDLVGFFKLKVQNETISVKNQKKSNQPVKKSNQESSKSERLRTGVVINLNNETKDNDYTSF